MTMQSGEQIHSDPAPAAAKKKRRRVWIIILPAPLLLLFLAGILLLGMPRRWQVDPAVSNSEMERMQGIIGKVTSAMVTEDGKMAESAVIKLTPMEVNTLLTVGLRAAQLRRPKDLYYDAEWIQGGLYLRVSRILPVLAVNAEIDIVPSVRNGIITLSVRACRVGRLPLSPGIVENLLQETLKKYENRQEFRAFNAFVESLTVRDGSVILQIRPQNSRLIFPLLLNTVMGRR